jgi:hypothetical protein
MLEGDQMSAIAKQADEQARIMIDQHACLEPALARLRGVIYWRLIEQIASGQSTIYDLVLKWRGIQADDSEYGGLQAMERIPYRIPLGLSRTEPGVCLVLRH